MNTRNRHTLRPPDAVRQDEDTGWRAAFERSTAWLVGFSFFSALLVMAPQAVMAKGVGEDGVTQTSVPRYFSVPNYANSPLPATVSFETTAGIGAAVVGTVDSLTGALTGVTVVAGGSGYAVNEVGSIGPATNPGTVTITAVDATTGAITAVAITIPGSGYGYDIGAAASANYVNGIRKFVDSLPGLNAAGANKLGQFIPVAVPDTTTYLGSDYYEIAIVEYTEKMHSDLPPTKLRGYVQLETTKVQGDHAPLVGSFLGVTKPHYLGPLIATTKDRPVRIKFHNLLPTGVAGNLFVPTDVTVLGAGVGPDLDFIENDPQNPKCGAPGAKLSGCYAENRATLHLHGGLSPWISDGTPHQWVTPAGETTSYPKGVSVKNVPDMPDPGDGAITFFYTNQQSARMMFYHDHAWGMTRLNVYVGGAAGYLISDDTEKKLLPATADNPTGLGLIPGPEATIPLIIQDKTFVPADVQLIPTDPLWDKDRWGDFGQLWAPHVYVPAQNPGDSSGVNQFGRWAYGPWFWPPTNTIDYVPINNPYHDPACNPDLTWCEPPLMPATPFNSMGMESFQDTPVVNGTAYPTLTVEPKAYRLRILNAANDRSFNLSLYKAVDAQGLACTTAKEPPFAAGVLAECTEAPLNPAEVVAALDDPTVFPTPLPNTEGPEWIQIGNEGGFLPAPVVIPAQPTTWVNDPTVFNAGNVDLHSLLVAPAERADVIVDFSAYAGQTLILYNDAPAAFPARDPRYDYYTGNGDYRDTGGAPPTIAGYGPNTRTVMQIKVGTAVTTPSSVSLTDLNTAFQSTSLGGGGVFESSQNPIIVGQGAYNSAYGTNFQTNGPRAGFVQIFDEILNFNTLAKDSAGQPLSLTIPLIRKAIQDEMGEAFEKEYGRMSGNLGLEAPNVQAGTQQNLILYPFVNPATEVVKPISLPPGVSLAPITSTDDGTQVWKITHNGVDTHPIHFHLFDVQLLNRVGWDGIIRKPDLNELGWKETVRISPLEDTIVALRPYLPKLPFGLPDSKRLLNPALPPGSTEMFNNTDAFGNPISPPITNVMTNFEWEYVWHCHILSHEEMDMMRPISALADPVLIYPPTGGALANGILSWKDSTPVDMTSLANWGNMANEIGFRIYRAPRSGNNVGPFTKLADVLANQTSYENLPLTGFAYRVAAYNAAGETRSVTINGATVAAPAAPDRFTARLDAPNSRVNLSWRDRSNNEEFFLVEVNVDGKGYTLINQANPNVTSFIDVMVAPGHTYEYRLTAVNAGGSSTPVMSAPIAFGAPPNGVPSNLTGTVAVQGKKATVNLTWADNSTNETGFEIERATNATFTVGSTITTVATNTTAATQNNLYRGVTYFFRVRAISNGGASAWSNVFSIVTP